MANILGQITLDQLQILEVDADPSLGVGTVASAGSTAHLSDGSASYRKNSAVDTDWVLISDNTTSILNALVFGGG
jgi:hypothetical protein